SEGVLHPVASARARHGPGVLASDGVMPRLLLVATIGLLVSATAHADVQPGDTITKTNADKIQDLVSPGMSWCVQHGFPLRIVEPKPIAHRRAFDEAIEKYSGQVGLGVDGLKLESYVAGLAFPHIDPNDSQAPM